MSYDHTAVALPVILPSHTKCLLLVFAGRCCPKCGLCWLGTKRLMDETGMGATRLRESLAELVKQDLVRIHAYPHGGRGRATEYIVLPGFFELSTAPCTACVAKMRNPSRGEGFDKPVTNKPTATRGVSVKPTAKQAKTHRTGGDQQSYNINSQARAARPADPPASPSGAATPPISDPTQPLSAEENLTRLRELMSSLASAIGPPSTRRAQKTPEPR